MAIPVEGVDDEIYRLGARLAQKLITPETYVVSLVDMYVSGEIGIIRFVQAVVDKSQWL